MRLLSITTTVSLTHPAVDNRTDVQPRLGLQARVPPYDVRVKYTRIVLLLTDTTSDASAVTHY